MAKPKWHTRWKVFPHGPLRTLEDNLMVVDAPVPGMPLQRRMTVVRLADGRLVVHNAIALDEASMGALESWGPIAFLIVPNSFHRLDAFAFKQRYPAVKVIAAPLARPKVELALPVDGGPELIPEGQGLRAEILDGAKIGEMAFIVEHGAKKTLVLNDALFNQPHLPGLSGFVMRLIGSTGPLKVTRIMKTFGIKDKKAFYAHLGRLAETPGLSRLIVSHGDILEGDDVATRMRAVLG